MKWRSLCRFTTYAIIIRIILLIGLNQIIFNYNNSYHIINKTCEHNTIMEPKYLLLNYSNVKGNINGVNCHQWGSPPWFLLATPPAVTWHSSLTAQHLPEIAVVSHPRSGDRQTSGITRLAHTDKVHYIHALLVVPPVSFQL